MCSRIRRSLALPLALFLVPGSAGAVLTAVDLNTPGDGLVTHDSTTDLYWLDMSETAGLSWDDFYAGVGGWFGSGWRHATFEEVCGLAIETAIDDALPCSDVFVFTGPELWSGLLGTTYNNLVFGGLAADAAYDDGNGDSTITHVTPVFSGVGGSGVTAGGEVTPSATTGAWGGPLSHLVVRTQCADGLDNDSDGLFDLADPDCADAQDDAEAPSQCNDGVDQDGDTLVDLADPDCTDVHDDAEWHLTTGDVLQNGLGDLHRIDPVTGASTPVGEFPDTRGNMALGSDGALYVMELVNSPENPSIRWILQRIDLDQGTTAPVAEVSGCCATLAPTADGRIFYGSGSLYSIDLASGVETLVSQDGLLTAGTATGPAHVLVEPSGTVLVVVHTNILNTVEPAILLRIDPSDGSQTQLASFGPINTAGIDFDANGDLIVASAGNIFTAVAPEFFRVPMPAGGVPVQLTSGTGLSFPTGGLIVEDDGVYGVGSWLLGGSSGAGVGIHRFPNGTTPPVLLTSEFGATPISAVRPPVGVGGPAACGNGIDDDGDGLVDFPDDPHCNTEADPTEVPACSDGEDNDLDGFVDLDDPDCTGPDDNREATGNKCGLGIELALLLPLLGALRRRRA